MDRKNLRLSTCRDSSMSQVPQKSGAKSEKPAATRSPDFRRLSVPLRQTSLQKNRVSDDHLFQAEDNSHFVSHPPPNIFFRTYNL